MSVDSTAPHRLITPQKCRSKELNVLKVLNKTIHPGNVQKWRSDECAADLTTRCHELLEKHSAAGRLTSVSRLEVFFCLSIGRNPDFLPETQQSVGLVSLIVLKTPLFYTFVYLPVWDL